VAATLIVLVPAARAALGVTAWQVGLATGALAVVSGVSFAIHRWLGPGRSFQRLELLRTWTAYSVGPVLLVAAQDGQSWFWVWFMVAVAFSASGGTRYHLLGVIAVPLLAGTALLMLYGDVAGFIVSALVSAVSVHAFITYRPVFARYAALLDRERHLRTVLVKERARVAQQRLARDLHDGLGADLTALVWQARGLQDQAFGETERQRLGSIAQEFRETLSHLRRAVVMLRRQDDHG